MFVRQATHARLKAAHDALARELSETRLDVLHWKMKWSELSDTYARMLLQATQEIANAQKNSVRVTVTGGGQQLSAEDIKRLLMLCHPDKHGGKPMATEMTAKLLQLRKDARP